MSAFTQQPTKMESVDTHTPACPGHVDLWRTRGTAYGAGGTIVCATCRLPVYMDEEGD